MSNTTYTQVVDEKTGEIKYVPNTPPQQNAGGGGHDKAKGDPREEEYREHARNALKKTNIELDDELTKVLINLTENNKRLRYNKRLQSGKLDGKRLTSYKTSDRLFKLKAIKDKHYQFTFLLDTSGSMMNERSDITKLAVACGALVKTVSALSDPQLNIRSSVIAMNNGVMLLKGFDDKFSTPKFLEGVVDSMSRSEYDEETEEGDLWCGGTAEMIAYRETLDYIARNSDRKVTNVVVVLSDGAPGGSLHITPVIMEDGERKEVDYNGSDDEISTLSRFWERQPEILSFGLGIMSDAKQIPTHRRVDDLEKLPEVMSNLLTNLML